MQAFDALVEGPLALLSLTVLTACVLSRGFFCVGTFSKGARARGSHLAEHSALTVLRWLAPLHKVIFRRPLYVVSRALFHVGLFTAVIGASGHTSMLEGVLPGLIWDSLPDSFVERATLVALFCLLWFVIRRTFFRSVRNQSTKSEHLLPFLVGLPLLTAYVAHNGWIEGGSALTAHIFSGEVLLVYVGVMFCTVKLDSSKCIACAACGLQCPTGALALEDDRSDRVMTYDHHQCVCCATCVCSCADAASRLRHEFNPGLLFRRKARVYRTAKLQACSVCGTHFAPYDQLLEVSRALAAKQLDGSALAMCATCKKRASIAQIRPFLNRNPENSPEQLQALG